MKITSMIARYLLGLMFTVFGLNGFLNFIHQPPPGESTGDSVFCCRQRIALCRVLFRNAIAGRTVIAFRLLRPTCADSVGGGTLQYPRFSPDAFTGDNCSGSGGLCTVGADLSSIPRKLQGHLQREACEAGMSCGRSQCRTRWPELTMAAFESELRPQFHGREVLFVTGWCRGKLA